METPLDDHNFPSYQTDQDELVLVTDSEGEPVFQAKLEDGQVKEWVWL